MSISPLERASDTPPAGEVHKESSETHITVISPDNPRWNEAIELESATFVRRGYVESPEELSREYAAYLPKTSIILAEHVATKEVSGCARVIEYDPEIGFKTLDDALDEEKSLEIDTSGWEALEEIDHDNIYEVGTISARQDAGAELYGAIIGYGLDKTPRRQYVIASLDEQVFMKRILPLFGDSVQILGPPADYMGSSTIPIMINLEKAWENIAANDYLQGIFERVEEGRKMVSHG
jgi:hypothetical protein